MKTSNYLLLFAISIVFVGCAGMMRQPLPVSERTTSYSFNSNKKRLELYQAAKFWLPTAFKSNGQIIQAEDKDTGKISGTGYIPCKELPGSSMANQFIEFQYLVNSSDKKLDIKFSNQRIFVPEDTYATKDDNIYNDKSQISGVKSCLDQLSNSLKDSI